MKIVFTIVFSVTMSGCIGAAIVKPGECSYSDPTVGMFDDVPALKRFVGISKKENATEKTKNDFLREWGRPDDIQSSDNNEIWIYKRNNWCGVVLCFVVCAPLILPVCDGFDQLTFEGETATLLTIDYPHGYGIIIFPFGGGGDFGNGPSQCRKRW